MYPNRPQVVPVVVPNWSPSGPKIDSNCARKEAKKEKTYLQEKIMKAQQGNVKTTKTVFKGDAGARNNDNDG